MKSFLKPFGIIAFAVVISLLMACGGGLGDDTVYLTLDQDNFASEMARIAGLPGVYSITLTEDIEDFPGIDFNGAFKITVIGGDYSITWLPEEDDEDIVTATAMFRMRQAASLDLRNVTLLFDEEAEFGKNTAAGNTQAVLRADIGGTIKLTNVNIDGGELVNGINIEGGNVTMESGLIENLWEFGVMLRSSSEQNNSSFPGGTFTMNGGTINRGDSTFTTPTRDDASGVNITQWNNTFIMNDGTISGWLHTGGQSAGVLLHNSGRNGTFTMNGGTISGNFHGVTVRGNQAATPNKAEIKGGFIKDNGTGIRVRNDGIAIMTDGIISGSDDELITDSTGAGVRIHENGSFTKTGGIINGDDDGTNNDNGQGDPNLKGAIRVDAPVQPHFFFVEAFGANDNYPMGEILGIYVTPATPTVMRGLSQAFTATVVASGTTTTVQWSVTDSEGETSTLAGGTKMEGNVLFVDAEESNATLIVKAACATNPITSYGIATATLSNPSLHKGAFRQFTNVELGIAADVEVTWNMTGSTLSGTKIHPTGFLTIAANETASTLIITATPATGDPVGIPVTAQDVTGANIHTASTEAELRAAFTDRTAGVHRINLTDDVTVTTALPDMAVNNVTIILYGDGNTITYQPNPPANDNTGATALLRVRRGFLILENVTIEMGSNVPNTNTGSDLIRVDNNTQIGTIVVKEDTIIKNHSRAAVDVRDNGVGFMTGGTFNTVGREGVRIQTGSTFTMFGGTITGTSVAGVRINNANSSFVMWGGTISGNAVGVRIERQRNARIDIKGTGGIITGNSGGTPNTTASIELRDTTAGVHSNGSHSRRILEIGADDKFVGNFADVEAIADQNWVGPAVP
ncbi:MAG: hypothetical protein LBC80_02925 [Treponema sp.]|nr:hypothetical protein [Treponema sp.]